TVGSPKILTVACQSESQMYFSLRLPNVGSHFLFFL
ncbi:uncharacterized protein METZ01_LOCUS311706, partial [marine metagenome]